MQDYFFQVCDIMDALATGRKKRLVNCAACCNDAPNQNVPCNANLCGLGKLINDLKYLIDNYNHNYKFILISCLLSWMLALKAQM